MAGENPRPQLELVDKILQFYGQIYMFPVVRDWVIQRSPS